MEFVAIFDGNNNLLESFIWGTDAVERCKALVVWEDCWR